MKTTKRKRDSAPARKTRATSASPIEADAPAEAVAEPLVEAAAVALAIPEAAPAPQPVADSTVAQPSEAASDNAAAVVLASHCMLKDAAALKQMLCAHLHQAEPVRLDASNVERVDTASMQLLCAFVRDRVKAGRAVEWIGAPEALRAAARLLGVGALLDLPAAAAGAAS